MYKKKIFKKKKIKILYIYIFFILIIFAFFLILSKFFLDSKDFFYIPINNKSFYLIPEDRGGKEIANKDKKGLHLSYASDENINLTNNLNILFSIQLFTHNNYNLVNKERNKILKNDDTIFLPEQLFIAILNSNLGKEYLLLYENFYTRNEAFDHCNKYAYFLDNCLIVNVQNLD